MKPPTLGHSFTRFPTIDSTNLYAMERIRAGLAVHGEVFFADEQTAGKGQRGRAWVSEPGENIQQTIVIECTKLAPSQRFRLSAAMAAGVHDWLQQVLPHSATIKWPNDIYMGDRKAGGILIENVMQASNWQWAIVGIGINVNQRSFHPALPNPTSLALVSGQYYDAAALGRELCRYLNARFLQLLQGGWHSILRDYNQVLYGKDQVRKLRVDRAVSNYLIRRVNDQGSLVCGEMEEYLFDFGTVEWVLDG